MPPPPANSESDTLSSSCDPENFWSQKPQKTHFGGSSSPYQQQQQQQHSDQLAEQLNRISGPPPLTATTTMTTTTATAGQPFRSSGLNHHHPLSTTKDSSSPTIFSNLRHKVTRGATKNWQKSELRPLDQKSIFLNHYFIIKLGTKCYCTYNYD